MLLAIDIGNTNINFGIFQGQRLIKKFAISTGSRDCYPRLKKICAAYEIKEACIASVVPEAQRRLAQALTGILRTKPYIIGKDIKVPIKNLYRKPAQVGQDRLVNAYAAVEFYGAPVIAVDFGTGLTIDVVSGRKEYLGGLILPGLQISLDTLAERAALLPRVKLGKPAGLIGTDTKNSILSGVVFGTAASVDDIISRLRKMIGRRALTVGTGGNIKFIAKYCRNIQRIDPDLTLKGINLIFCRDRFETCPYSRTMERR
ncbi:MAG: type III pantothenate kinase [Candidatus Omnitrophota bacterium]|nr:type III pantothenate kinase [Candidatus Omnitrophota bacterium]